MCDWVLGEPCRLRSTVSMAVEAPWGGFFFFFWGGGGGRHRDDIQYSPLREPDHHHHPLANGCFTARRWKRKEKKKKKTTCPCSRDFFADSGPPRNVHAVLLYVALFCRFGSSRKCLCYVAYLILQEEEEGGGEGREREKWGKRGELVLWFGGLG